MSSQAMSWALRQNPSLGRKGFGPKLLLVVLAEAAGKDGVTILGRKALAEHCNTDRSATITELYEQLERLELVKRVERRRDNGSRTSDWTVLAPLAADRGEMVDATPESGQLPRPREVCEVACRITGADNERGTLNGPDQAVGETDRGTLNVEVRSAERNGQVRPSVGPYEPPEEPKENLSEEAAKAASSSEEESPTSILPRRELIELSHRLADGIRLNDAKAPVKPDHSTWLEPLRLLVQRDGRSIEEIGDVIDWVLADEFNRKTVLSPRTLRRRFPELAQKADVATPGESDGLKIGNFRRPRRGSSVLADCPTTSGLAAEWEPIRAELEAAVNDDATFNIWLAGLHLHNTGNELVLGCPAESKAWIRDRFGRLIEGVAEKSIVLVACGCDSGAVAA